MPVTRSNKRRLEEPAAEAEQPNKRAARGNRRNQDTGEATGSKTDTAPQNDAPPATVNNKPESNQVKGKRTARRGKGSKPSGSSQEQAKSPNEEGTQPPSAPGSKPPDTSVGPSVAPASKANKASNASELKSEGKDEGTEKQEMAGRGHDEDEMRNASSALQGLLRRLGAGFDEAFMSMAGMGGGGRFRSIVNDLRQAEDEGAQFAALTELHEILVISSEDSVTAFPTETAVPLLVQCLSAEHNPDMMLLAARCLTLLADLLPTSCACIVRNGAVASFCERLLNIEYIDLAEQSLLALEKLSHQHAHTLLQAGGLLAVLSFLDFFPSGVQRVAVGTAANMCRGLTAEHSQAVKEAIPILNNLLTYQDAKVVDSACLALHNIAESYASKPDLLSLLSSGGVIQQVPQMLALKDGGASVSQLAPGTYYRLIKLLATCSSKSPAVASMLLEGQLLDTLYTLLSTSSLLPSQSTAAGNAAAQQAMLRSADELHEIIALLEQLLPPVGNATTMIVDGQQYVPPDEDDAGGSSDSAPDERAVFFRSHEDTAEKVITQLVPICMQLYGCTVMAHVKQGCLDTMLRLLALGTPAMLQTSLKSVPVSSFMATLMTSRDSPSLAMGMLMCEIFMTKLPSICKTRFLKEGVVQALQQVAKVAESKVHDAAKKTSSADEEAKEAASGGLEKEKRVTRSSSRRNSAAQTKDVTGTSPPATTEGVAGASGRGGAAGISPTGRRRGSASPIPPLNTKAGANKSEDTKADKSADKGKASGKADGGSRSNKASRGGSPAAEGGRAGAAADGEAAAAAVPSALPGRPSQAVALNTKLAARAAAFVQEYFQDCISDGAFETPGMRKLRDVVGKLSSDPTALSQLLLLLSTAAVGGDDSEKQAGAMEVDQDADQGDEASVGDISAYELVNSGVVKALSDYLQGTELTDGPTDTVEVMNRIRTFVQLALAVDSGEHPPLQKIMQKLQSALAASENFTVCQAPNPAAVSSRTGAGSMYNRITGSHDHQAAASLSSSIGSYRTGLAALSKPIKLRLSRYKSERALRDYGHNVVLIEPMASMTAIEDFLYPRVYQTGSSGGGGGSASMAATAAAAERTKRTEDSKRTSPGRNKGKEKDKEQDTQEAEAKGAAGGSSSRGKGSRQKDKTDKKDAPEGPSAASKAGSRVTTRAAAKSRETSPSKEEAPASAGKKTTRGRKNEAAGNASGRSAARPTPESRRRAARSRGRTDDDDDDAVHAGDGDDKAGVAVAAPASADQLELASSSDDDDDMHDAHMMPMDEDMEDAIMEDDDNVVDGEHDEDDDDRDVDGGGLPSHGHGLQEFYDDDDREYDDDDDMDEGDEMDIPPMRVHDLHVDDMPSLNTAAATAMGPPSSRGAAGATATATGSAVGRAASALAEALRTFSAPAARSNGASQDRDVGSMATRAASQLDAAAAAAAAASNALRQARDAAAAASGANGGAGNAWDRNRAGSGAVRSEQPRLVFYVGDIKLPSTTTVFQAVQTYIQQRSANNDDGEDEQRPSWDGIYVLSYRAATPDDAVPPSGAGGGSSFAAISSQPHNAVTGLSSLPDIVSIPIGALVPVQQVRSVTIPSDLTAEPSCLQLIQLTKVLAIVNKWGARLCHAIEVEEEAVNAVQEAADVRSGKKHKATSACSASQPAEDSDKPVYGRLNRQDLVSNKLNSKLQQQLKDVLSVAGGGVPVWCKQLVFNCKHLFTFEARRRYFYCTALGMERALQHIQNMHASEAGGGGGGGAGGGGTAADRARDTRLARLGRQKVRVSRKRILESAMKVMELYASPRDVLELEYFGEVGTGLGPTLEFYTLLSHDLQKRSLRMWRHEDAATMNRAGGDSNSGATPIATVPDVDAADKKATNAMEVDEVPGPIAAAARSLAKTSSLTQRVSQGLKPATATQLHAEAWHDDTQYVNAPWGLFPAPLPPQDRKDTKILDLFKLLGRSMAKALQDSRLMDLPLNYTFYRAAQGQPLDLYDVANFDPVLGQQLEKLWSALVAARAAAGHTTAAAPTPAAVAPGTAAAATNTAAQEAKDTSAATITAGNKDESAKGSNKRNARGKKASAGGAPRGGNKANKKAEEPAGPTDTAAAAAAADQKQAGGNAVVLPGRSVMVDGVAIEDLCLTFTLPGYPDFELVPGGGDVMVDSSNLGDWIQCVLDATLGCGIAAQMEQFKTGFNEVIPLSSLSCFYEDEIEALLCGSGDAWDVATLSAAIKFDHGYSPSSPVVTCLLEVLCDLDGADKKRFLRFVTGCPRLPAGGLAALQPRLTVVRKHPSRDAHTVGLGTSAGTTPSGLATRASHDVPLGSGTVLADGDLPSVMTCANYIKLPPYSCKEVLRERLLYAIREGQGSFDLS